MASILDIANPNETKTVHVQLTLRNGQKRPFEVSYYPNKLTMEPIDLDGEDDDEDDEVGKTSLRNATSFCDMMAGWELEGPIHNREGVEVVAAGQRVPLEPRIVRCVPTWITTQVTNEIMGIEFPNPNRSTGSRRR